MLCSTVVGKSAWYGENTALGWKFSDNIYVRVVNLFVFWEKETNQSGRIRVFTKYKGEKKRLASHEFVWECKKPPQRGLHILFLLFYQAGWIYLPSEALNKKNTKTVKLTNAKKQTSDHLLFTYRREHLHINSTKYASIKYEIAKEPSIAEK